MSNLEKYKYSKKWKQSSVRIIIVLVNKCIFIRGHSDTNSSFQSLTRFNKQVIFCVFAAACIDAIV